MHACNVKMLPSSEVTGDAVAEQMLLFDGGVVNGSVQSRTAAVDGTVNGAVTLLESLEIKSCAIIKGDVTAPKVAIEQGAVVFGKFAAG